MIYNMTDNYSFWYFASFTLFIIGLLAMIDSYILSGFIAIMLSFIFATCTFATQITVSNKQNFNFENFDNFNDYVPIRDENKLGMKVIKFCKSSGAIIKNVKNCSPPINYEVLELNEPPKVIKIPKSTNDFKTSKNTFMNASSDLPLVILYENTEKLEPSILDTYDAIIRVIKSVVKDDNNVKQILSTIEHVDNYNGTITILYNSPLMFDFFTKTEFIDLLKAHLEHLKNQNITITIEEYKFQKIYNYYLNKNGQ